MDFLNQNLTYLKTYKNLFIKNNLKYGEIHNQFKYHYRVLSKLDLSKCNQITNQLSSCQESYLIKKRLILAIQ